MIFWTSDSGGVSFTQGSRIKPMPLASFIKECERENEKKNEVAIYYYRVKT